MNTIEEFEFKISSLKQEIGHDVFIDKIMKDCITYPQLKSNRLKVSKSTKFQSIQIGTEGKVVSGTHKSYKNALLSLSDLSDLIALSTIATNYKVQILLAIVGFFMLLFAKSKVKLSTEIACLLLLIFQLKNTDNCFKNDNKFEDKLNEILISFGESIISSQQLQFLLKQLEKLGIIEKLGQSNIYQLKEKIEVDEVLVTD